MNEIIRSQYHGHISQLRRIINSWNLIPGSPSDEFDTLANKLLSHLYKAADLMTIRNIIESDLVTIYGLYTHEINAESFANV
ncbi:hypothetical protein [Sphingobacterium haloxyli]|uniref:Uncharacterized protein n=1 Tax=Sphingobacterium haloxyli TaxID=2100533 RepID=A0A2S9IYC4_9SPHI|nr:hypothetical protein [Sphingobacterium haloxyli]PRD45529.1 hypothetical protein C5745_17605 [Sphingobacterium haloxyli]